MCVICDNYKNAITVNNCLDILFNLNSDTKVGSIVRLSGDCPIDDVDGHVRNETMLTITQNFRCSCGKQIKWGVCIRGAPILTVC
jgi:hypothetical protein